MGKRKYTTSPDPDTQVNTEVIDPDGDVVLTLPQSAGSSPIKLQVSSRHLSLASPVFKAMFTGRFAESKTLRTSGSVTIKLDYDDQAAMLILMRIIHCKFYSVPASVDLGTLKHIAILVDKYSLHETVHYSINSWVDKIDMQASDMEDLKAWLCICWVFLPTTEISDHQPLVAPRLSISLRRDRPSNTAEGRWSVSPRKKIFIVTQSVSLLILENRTDQQSSERHDSADLECLDCIGEGVLR